jgi:hypothetical protein
LWQQLCGIPQLLSESHTNHFDIGSDKGQHLSARYRIPNKLAGLQSSFINDSWMTVKMSREVKDEQRRRSVSARPIAQDRQSGKVHENTNSPVIYRQSCK